MVSLNVALPGRPERIVSVACAVTDQANSALILTAEIVRKLMLQELVECNAVCHRNNDKVIDDDAADNESVDASDGSRQNHTDNDCENKNDST